MDKYSISLTSAGVELVAKGLVTESHVPINRIAVGDSENANVEDAALLKSLVNEKYRATPIFIPSDDKGVIIIDCVVPPDVGGFYIDEIGLFSGDILVAYGRIPRNYKSALSDGMATSAQITIYFAINQGVLRLEMDKDSFVTVKYLEAELEKLKSGIGTRDETVNKEIEELRDDLKGIDALKKELKLLKEKVESSLSSGNVATVPVGGIFPIATCYGAPEPDNQGEQKYVLLSAKSPYNKGLLINENVTARYHSNGSRYGSVVEATAVVNCPDSPMHGKGISLINTESRFIRPGEKAGAVSDDMIRDFNIYECNTEAQRNGFQGGWYQLTTLRNAWNRTVTANSMGASTGPEVKPKTVDLPYYMRIK